MFARLNRFKRKFTTNFIEKHACYLRRLTIMKNLMNVEIRNFNTKRFLMRRHENEKDKSCFVRKGFSDQLNLTWTDIYDDRFNDHKQMNRRSMKFVRKWKRRFHQTSSSRNNRRIIIDKCCLLISASINFNLFMRERVFTSRDHAHAWK